jgi:COP9 signalosome complex subunit 7
MDSGLNTGAKLEPFLLMAKSARGAAAAKLVSDACAAPGVFVFGELVDTPSIQDVCLCVRGPETYLADAAGSSRITSNMRRTTACSSSSRTGRTRTTSVRPIPAFMAACRPYRIFTGDKETLPALNPAQITKLKQLTLVTLASSHRVRPPRRCPLIPP